MRADAIGGIVWLVATLTILFVEASTSPAPITPAVAGLIVLGYSMLALAAWGGYLFWEDRR